MEYKGPDFSKLASKLIDIQNVIDPPLPMLPDLETMKVTSAIDTLKHNSLLNELDNLEYNLKLKKVEKKNYEERLNSIRSSSDICVGIILSIIVAIISIVIPFIIVAFNNYLEKYKNIIFWYMIISFILSMFFLLGYLIYSYKSNK